jgi:trk system potassium uptake protein TrkA
LCRQVVTCSDDGVHLIIVGCGRVGSELAVSLAAGSHEVVVIDRNAGAFDRLPDGWRGRTVVGLGFDRDTLKEAEIDTADALAAVTSGDNSNILTARVAREHYEVPNVVARIYDPRRAELYQRLGIPTVATVTWTVEQVVRRLFPEQSVTEWTDPSGQIVLVERAIPSRWVGRSLNDLLESDGCRLVSLRRSGHPILARAGIIGQEGDLLYLAALKDAIELMDEQLGRAR